MSDKQLYEVLTKSQGGHIYRYIIEYHILPEFNNHTEYSKWMEQISRYFQRRTAIYEEILEIRPSKFISSYNYESKCDLKED